MIDREFLEVLNEDVRILTSRALHGKSVTAFGIDGNGEYGTDYHGHQYVIDNCVSSVNPYSIMAKPEAHLMVSLLGYTAMRYGHITTDQNLRISLNKLFSDEHINPDCWTWGRFDEQGPNFFVLQLDVNMLLDW